MAARPPAGKANPARPNPARPASLPTSLYAAAQLYTGERLQDLLLATIDLGLVVDHAHWNVRGPGSHPLQRQFDSLSVALAGQRALLARRAAELGAAPDGRTGTVAADSSLPGLREGPLRAADAVAAVVDGLDEVADLAREQLSGPGASDPEARYVVTGLTRLIERHRGMLQRVAA
ncbi:MAG: starvation/stationary phase protection protein [Solirubrobacterales bacterium]|nr:starvation/stationary phase protection protein [Solirubrobacterales bacterium]